MCIDALSSIFIFEQLSLIHQNNYHQFGQSGNYLNRYSVIQNHNIYLFKIEASMIASDNPFYLPTHSQANNQLTYDDIKWGNMENYVINKKLGRGRYSHVFQGTDKRNSQKVVIKVLVPIKNQKIRREYQIMESLYHPNICKIKDIVKSDHQQTTSLILQYCHNTDFRDLYHMLTLNEIKIYIRQLFQGLDYLHSMGIMHRDIKPFNLMIDCQAKKLKIIDFGLSEYYDPKKEYSDQVCSLYYRAPQLILGRTFYDYSVDIWAAGLVLAGMIFKKTPLLQGKDSIDQLLKLMKLLGTENLVQYIKANNLIKSSATTKQNICLDVISAFESGQIMMAPKSNYNQFINKGNKQNCTSEALDLIDKLLSLNPQQRPTAKQALHHPFLKI